MYIDILKKLQAIMTEKEFLYESTRFIQRRS